MSPVRFGIDEVLADPKRLGGRLGLVTNEAARTAQDPQLHTRVALQRAGVSLVRLFAPEHGLGADAADGTAVPHGFDPLTGLSVVSLYGETLSPPPESLADLDAVVFDLPDLGARFYTYIWTLWHVRAACATAGVRLIVLDRPNPLGGDLAAVEGPILDVERYGSFLGRAAIPIRHALTVGELARLWNAEATTPACLEVVPCTGWSRALHWPDTGLPFVPTSPAIRCYEAALLYPGLCFFEATNLSVGRSTPWAFQVVGAPWLDAPALADTFNSLALPGLRAETMSFTPTVPPHAGMPCAGVRLVVTDRRAVRPVRTGLRLLTVVIQTHRAQFAWRDYPTVANPTGAGHFERLVGVGGLRELLETNPPDLARRLEHVTAPGDWSMRVQSALLYK